MNTRSSSAATQPATLRGDPSSKPSAIPNPISTVGLTVVDPPVAAVVMPNAKCPPAPDDFEPFVFTQIRAELGPATAVVADNPILVGETGQRLKKLGPTTLKTLPILTWLQPLLLQEAA